MYQSKTDDVGTGAVVWEILSLFSVLKLRIFYSIKDKVLCKRVIYNLVKNMDRIEPYNSKTD